MGNTSKLRRSGSYAVYKGRTYLIYWENKESQVELFADGQEIIVSSRSELTSAYRLYVRMEVDGYKLTYLGYDKETDLYEVSFTTEEMANHFHVPFNSYDGTYNTINVSIEQMDSIWEEREPIKGFPFNIAPVAYYKIYGQWLDEMLE